jgi:aldose 1-epimerase
MHFRSSRKLLAVISASAVTVGLIATLAGGASAQSSSHARKAAPRGGCVTISGRLWGTLTMGSNHVGQRVNMYTLINGNGMRVNISNYGGIVQSIRVRDRARGLRNVALGFPANAAGLLQYETMFQNPPSGGSGNTYFGAIIGRYANRIANHSFTLNGTTYNLVGNNGPNNINTLHGGPDAYNAQVWTPTILKTGCNRASLQLTYTDPAGKNGFPGTVQNTVIYSLTNNNALAIRYHATTDAPTVINLTNHTYFNLRGEGSGTVYNQLLQINANRFQPTDANLIPTGFANVAGTPFDFRRLKPIGRDIRNARAPQGDQLVTAHGYDHNWVLNGSGFKLASVAQDPTSGITLATYTTEPGVQMYTGNFLVGDLVGTSGRTYRQSDGFTLETQHFPDTPHHIGQPGWPSVVLNPGAAFNSRTTYQFSVAAASHRRNR